MKEADSHFENQLSSGLLGHEMNRRQLLGVSLALPAALALNRVAAPQRFTQVETPVTPGEVTPLLGDDLAALHQEARQFLDFPLLQTDMAHRVKVDPATAEVPDEQYLEGTHFVAPSSDFFHLPPNHPFGRFEGGEFDSLIYAPNPDEPDSYAHYLRDSNNGLEYAVSLWDVDKSDVIPQSMYVVNQDNARVEQYLDGWNEFDNLHRELWQRNEQSGRKLNLDPGGMRIAYVKKPTRKTRKGEMDPGKRETCSKWAVVAVIGVVACHFFRRTPVCAAAGNFIVQSYINC